MLQQGSSRWWCMQKFNILLALSSTTKYRSNSDKVLSATFQLLRRSTFNKHDWIDEHYWSWNLYLTQKKHHSGLEILCIGFTWQGFASKQAAGVASVRSFQKIPLCEIKAVADGSRADLPPSKVAPTSGSDSIFSDNIFKNGNKQLCTSSWGEE